MTTFSVLGPLEVSSETASLKPKGTFQRILLLTLLVNEGRLTSIRNLVDELWGDDRSPGVGNALQAHVSRLRRSLRRLEPERQAQRLVSRCAGYQLLLEPGELDATQFVTRFAAVRRYSDDEPRRAVRELRSALTLWRGPVFGGSNDQNLWMCFGKGEPSRRMI